MYWTLGVLLFLFCLSGCANVFQKDVLPTRKPGVLEEDITDARRPQPDVSEQQTYRPDVAGPPAPPVEGYVPGADTGNRPPRRIIWRDRKGSERQAEPAVDGSSDRRR